MEISTKEEFELFTGQRKWMEARAKEAAKLWCKMEGSSLQGDFQKLTFEEGYVEVVYEVWAWGGCDTDVYEIPNECFYMEEWEWVLKCAFEERKRKEEMWKEQERLKKEAAKEAAERAEYEKLKKQFEQSSFDRQMEK